METPLFSSTDETYTKINHDHRRQKKSQHISKILVIHIAHLLRPHVDEKSAVKRSFYNILEI